MDLFFYIPEINPVIFVDEARALEAGYNFHFLEDWHFTERFMPWQSSGAYSQIWQTDDIVVLQFESMLDPVILEVLNNEGNAVITNAALVGLPHTYISGLYSYDVQQSLAGLSTGYYTFRLSAGDGVSKKTFRSSCQYISAEAIPTSIKMEYWHEGRTFHKDVMWVTGLKMQYRTYGYLGFLDIQRTDVYHRDQQWITELLSAKRAKQYPFYVGDEFGIPDEHYNIIDHIWGVDHVTLDGRLFGLADGAKVEAIDAGADYPKRGFKFIVEDGLNRNSRIFSATADTNKKIMAQVFVDSKAFGDTSNQGSNNTVPVITFM